MAYHGEAASDPERGESVVSHDQDRPASPAAMEATAKLLRVSAAVGAPDFILPWLDRFYDAEDAELIAAAASTG